MPCNDSIAQENPRLEEKRVEECVGRGARESEGERE